MKSTFSDPSVGQVISEKSFYSFDEVKLLSLTLKYKILAFATAAIGRKYSDLAKCHLIAISLKPKSI